MLPLSENSLTLLSFHLTLAYLRTLFLGTFSRPLFLPSTAWLLTPVIFFILNLKILKSNTNTNNLLPHHHYSKQDNLTQRLIINIVLYSAFLALQLFPS
jgi:hypothetical protein